MTDGTMQLRCCWCVSTPQENTKPTITAPKRVFDRIASPKAQQSILGHRGAKFVKLVYAASKKEFDRVASPEVQQPLLRYPGASSFNRAELTLEASEQ